MREKFHNNRQHQVGITYLFCLLAQEGTEAPEQWSGAEDGLGTTVAFIRPSFHNSVFYGFISRFYMLFQCLILIFL